MINHVTIHVNAAHLSPELSPQIFLQENIVQKERKWC